MVADKPEEKDNAPGGGMPPEEWVAGRNGWHGNVLHFHLENTL